MANDSEHFLGPSSWPIVQESLPSNTLNTLNTSTPGNDTVNSRAYQMEMLEESLKRNIIVAVYSILLLVTPIVDNL